MGGGEGGSLSNVGCTNHWYVVPYARFTTLPYNHKGSTVQSTCTLDRRYQKPACQNTQSTSFAPHVVVNIVLCYYHYRSMNANWHRWIVICRLPLCQVQWAGKSWCKMNQQDYIEEKSVASRFHISSLLISSSRGNSDA